MLREEVGGKCLIRRVKSSGMPLRIFVRAAKVLARWGGRFRGSEWRGCAWFGVEYYRLRDEAIKDHEVDYQS